MPLQNVTPGMMFFSHCAGRLMGVVRIPLLSCGDEHPESRMTARMETIRQVMIMVLCGFFIYFALSLQLRNWLLFE
jgi:hypothetical protein